MTQLRRPAPPKARIKFMSQTTCQAASLAVTFAFCLVLVLKSAPSPYDQSMEDEEGEAVLFKSGGLLEQQNGGKFERQGGPIVDTSYGKIRGKILKSRDGRNYSAFYQIPYAQPPIGQYRFQPPRPLKKQKWRGTRDATVVGSSDTSCIQFKKDSIAGREDCLYLNVFTPELPRRGRRRPNLPVMVYFFGGAYLFGKSSGYGADYILDEDVILVLVEYRVGNIGYLNTEDSEIRGNQASKDHVMALKWVQSEIRNFGGDRKRVLIFGNSSGGASVHALMLSPMANGLFSRAISQSGSAVLQPGDGLVRPRDSAKQLGRQLNCSDVENTKALHQCLIDADAQDLVSIRLDAMLFFSKDGAPDENGEPFFPDQCENLMKNGEFSTKVPWLVGANSAEAYANANNLLVNPKLLDELNENWDTLSPPLLNFHDDNLTHEAARSLYGQYFGSEPITRNDSRWELTDLMSDTKWVHPISVAARHHAQNGGQVYFYWLTKEPIQSQGEKAKFDFESPFGVAHADEVQYFFPFDRYPYIGANDTDYYKFTKKLIREWVHFAETGAPSDPEWKPLDSSESNSIWMELGDDFKLMEPQKITQRMTFLDTFPFDHPTYF